MIPAKNFKLLHLDRFFRKIIGAIVIECDLYWFSELNAEYEKPADSSTIKVQYYEWENLFRLTEPGRYWADWAIIMEYSYAIDDEEKDAYQNPGYVF